MRIKNMDGNSWISQFDESGKTIHIIGGEVTEFEVKGMMIIIKLEMNEK